MKKLWLRSISRTTLKMVDPDNIDACKKFCIFFIHQKTSLFLTYNICRVIFLFNVFFNLFVSPEPLFLAQRLIMFIKALQQQ